jgi:hypothetical protein
MRKYLRHAALLALALLYALILCLLVVVFSKVANLLVAHYPTATASVVLMALVAYCYHQLKELT